MATLDMATIAIYYSPITNNEKKDMKYIYTILINNDKDSILHGMETSNFDSALLIEKALVKDGFSVTIQTRVAS